MSTGILTLSASLLNILHMGSLEEKRERFQAQIAELRRLAEEAEACAQLLRDQADSHAKLLEDESLTEERLDRLLADKPKREILSKGVFSLTEGLM